MAGEIPESAEGQQGVKVLLETLRNPWIWAVGQAVAAAFLLKDAPKWVGGLALLIGSAASFTQAIIEKHAKREGKSDEV